MSDPENRAPMGNIDRTHRSRYFISFCRLPCIRACELTVISMSLAPSTNVVVLWRILVLIACFFSLPLPAWSQILSFGQFPFLCLWLLLLIHVQPVSKFTNRESKMPSCQENGIWEIKIGENKFYPVSFKTSFRRNQMRRKLTIVQDHTYRARHPDMYN